MRPVPGLDASYDLLTDERAQALVAEGNKVYAQCLWTGVEQPANRVINLRAASIAGLLLVGYVSISHGASGSWHVNKGLAGIPDDLLKLLIHVPIDVELVGITREDVASALNMTHHAWQPVVYTSFGQWMSMGNPGIDAWLWDANWDGDPTLSAKRGYGAFRGLFGKQYLGGHPDPSGLNCDSDTFDLDILQPGPVPPTPEPTPDPVGKTHQVDVFSDGSIKVS